MPHFITGTIFVIFAILTIWFIWKGHTTCRNYSWKGRWVIGWLVSAAVALAFGFIFVVCLWVPQYSEHACHRWGEETEREVKFIRPTYWQWSCVVHTDEGWVENTNTIKVDD